MYFPGSLNTHIRTHTHTHTHTHTLKILPFITCNDGVVSCRDSDVVLVAHYWEAVNVLQAYHRRSYSIVTAVTVTCVVS